MLYYPFAIKVEENKINDDQTKKNKIRIVKNNDICFRNRMNNIYGLKAPFLPGTKEKRNDDCNIIITFKKLKSSFKEKILNISKDALKI